MAEFGEQLKHARESKGMTQQSLADKVYVTRQTVSRWESGDRYPDILTLKRLSSVLNVSADFLLSDEQMTDIAEKTPLIEKPVFNNILVALYAAIVLVFSIQAYNLLGSFYTLDAITGKNYFAIFMCCCALSEAALFVFSFINTLRGTFIPQKAGIVICAFFILELFQRIETVFNRAGLWTLVFAMLCFLPYLSGAIGAYSFFISSGKQKHGKILVCFASLFSAYTQLAGILILIGNYPGYVSLPFLLSRLLKLLISAVFIFQVYLLSKRRSMAVSSGQSSDKAV